MGYNIFTVPADIEITRGFRGVKETTIRTCILLHTVVQSQDTDKGGVMVYGATEHAQATCRRESITTFLPVFGGQTSRFCQLE